MTSSRWIKVGAVGTVCALAGAGAGIAGSSAATSGGKKSTTRASTAKELRHGGPGRGFGGPAVHEEAVVLAKDGKSFITVTRDNGTVKSVSGSTVVITEGTKDVTYKDVTVTIPDSATITRNGKDAKVADLKAGDRIGVSASSDGTFVFAADDTFKPAGPKGGPMGGPGRGGFHGHGGPGFGPGGPAGPYGAPPAAPTP